MNETFLERYLPGTAGSASESRFGLDGCREATGAGRNDPGGGGRGGGTCTARTGTGHHPFFWVSYLQDVPGSGHHPRQRDGWAPKPWCPSSGKRLPPGSDEFTLIDPGPYQALIDYRFLGHRLTSTVLSFTGLFALILAFIGVFGIVSFSVTQRFREMAIRQAMGAQDGQVFRGVVAQV